MQQSCRRVRMRAVPSFRCAAIVLAAFVGGCAAAQRPSALNEDFELAAGRSIRVADTDFVVRLALGHLGLSPSDVTILQVGGSQSRLVALKAGTIDGTVLSPEEALAAQKVGLNTLLDFVAKGVEFPHVNMVAREDYLQTQATQVKRFMVAYVEGIRFFKTHKDEAVRKMMVLSRLNDREIAEKAFDVYSRSLPDDGRPTIKGLEAVLVEIAKEDPKAKGLTVSQIVDLSFLPSGR